MLPSQNCPIEATSQEATAEGKITGSAGPIGQTRNVPGAEKPRMPKSRIRIVMFSLCLALFLSALDITIVATALPTIAAHLHASASEYTWIGSSYTLASTASTPLWAKFSDIWGRKPIILLANGVFLVGSLVSATSLSIDILICGRILQGLGGGGMGIMISIVIADLFKLEDRAKYYGFSAIVWAVASGLGPVLGGIFTQRVSWRWCFYINVPLDGISLVFVAIFLKLETPRTTLRGGLQAFDWIGSIAIVGGTTCFLYGLESGAGGTHSWGSAFTLCLIISGIFLVGLFIFYEAKYARHPLVPIRIFKNVSNVASLGTAFCHSFVFIAYDYFLPLYFQVVLGFSPITSGLCLFALVLPLSAFTMGTGFFVARTGNYRYAIWFGLAIMTAGTGLFTSFGSQTVWWKIIVFQIITGIGAGPLFQSPLIALQSHLNPADVAAGTSAFTFLRSIATSVSVVVGGVVLQHGLGSNSLTNPKHQESQREATYIVYTAALRKMWIFYASVCGAAILFSLFVRKKGLRDVEGETVLEIQEGHSESQAQEKRQSSNRESSCEVGPGDLTRKI